ncbi:hypothetical protein BRAS3809_5570003 [Bradyrhizobium sp. STM 3809]|nr:hypothetical protein BRAS3809_5570003 [Bradyrhizobium sp. STM 3809]
MRERTQADPHPASREGQARRLLAEQRMIAVIVSLLMRRSGMLDAGGVLIITLVVLQRSRLNRSSSVMCRTRMPDLIQVVHALLSLRA